MGGVEVGVDGEENGAEWKFKDVDLPFELESNVIAEARYFATPI